MVLNAKLAYQIDYLSAYFYSNYISYCFYAIWPAREPDSIYF